MYGKATAQYERNFFFESLRCSSVIHTTIGGGLRLTEPGFYTNSSVSLRRRWGRPICDAYMELSCKMVGKWCKKMRPFLMKEANCE
jgi:hypothetical protein